MSQRSSLLTSPLVLVLALGLAACSSAETSAPPGEDAGADVTVTPPVDAGDAATVEDAPPPVDAQATEQKCANCHVAQSGAALAGKHSKLEKGCLHCHKDALQHQLEPSKTKASIDFSLEGCGACHAPYVASYTKDDGAKVGKYGGSAKTSKYIDFPNYQHLMGGHGFTIEYNEERAHAYALKDHIDIKRKQNMVCLQCKSTPITYYWNEQRRGASVFGKDVAWADAVNTIRTNYPSTIDHGTACTHCHDPHSGNFRVIRKSMINAILERGTDPYDPALNFIPKTVNELNAKLNERGADGKLTADAKRLVGTITCSQCHVEYTCGPGADKTVLRDDFPWRKVRDLEDYYRIKYDTIQDWVHTGTGLRGIKAQHPETEFYWESVHSKNKVACADCHMAKGGKERSHWFTSPLKQPTDTCGTCHNDVATRVGRVTSIQDGVMTKAKTVENGLNDVLTRIEALATDPNFDAAKLKSAKESFMRGLLFWEFTVVSENSAGFHNPAEAHASLDTSLGEIAKAKALLGI